eukprot:TRINITY_DN4003_c0_g1_i1.p1 TRINITY_DN4003_c0_g1~~TRINITY_DN4003_c0_g1_i1.p1  ORF type:complete len:381 (+),score=37.21 TRINITY_DN4003_c0_g1_i1:660-1802(+)
MKLPMWLALCAIALATLAILLSFTSTTVPLDAAPAFRLDASPESLTPTAALHSQSVAAWYREYSNAAIVYTWVNTSDPLDKELRTTLGRPPNPRAMECREHEQLRYSMRAMQQFMPWHRGRIYLVTPGYWPHWLNRSHPRLQLVAQTSLLDSPGTLAMNSNAYEQRLHRIPGITKFFIHMNDDYMLGKKTKPWDFFLPGGGVKLFMGPSEIEWSLSTLRNLTSAHWRGATAKSWDLVDREFGTTGKRIPHLRLRHAPFAYNSEAFDEIHRRWGLFLRACTTHPFRRYDDVITPILHHAVVLYGQIPNVWGQVDSSWDLLNEHTYVSFSLRQPLLRKHLTTVAVRRPRIFTVNGACSERTAADYYLDWLEHFYPEKSSFEL